MRVGRGRLGVSTAATGLHEACSEDRDRVKETDRLFGCQGAPTPKRDAQRLRRAEISSIQICNSMTLFLKAHTCRVSVRFEAASSGLGLMLLSSLVVTLTTSGCA